MLHTIFDNACLIVGGVLAYFCIRDPHADFTETDRVRTESHSLGHALRLLNLVHLIYVSFFFTELYLNLNPQPPHSHLLPLPEILQRLFPSLLSGPESSLVTSDFRPLVLLIFLASGTIRLWAMNTLGRLFTFTLSIRKGHKLITDGPYAYARHPSYTGIYGLIASCTFIIATSELMEKAVGLRTVIIHTGWPGALAVMIMAFINVVRCDWYYMGPRMKNEEAMLEGEFGKEWVLYKKNVPYRLFPFIC